MVEGVYLTLFIRKTKYNRLKTSENISECPLNDGRDKCISIEYYDFMLALITTRSRSPHGICGHKMEPPISFSLICRISF